MTNAFSLRTELALGTGLTRRALHRFNISHTALVRITGLSLWTFTPVVALCVLAEGAPAAGVAQALVDIDTAGLALTGGLVALQTHAPRLPVQQRALRVRGAEDVGTRT